MGVLEQHGGHEETMQGERVQEYFGGKNELWNEYAEVPARCLLEVERIPGRLELKAPRPYG